MSVLLLRNKIATAAEVTRMGIPKIKYAYSTRYLCISVLSHDLVNFDDVLAEYLWMGR